MGCREKKNSILRTIFLLFIFYLCEIQLLTLNPGQSIDQFVLEQWKDKEGLASNSIYSITQTPDGYLWFATFSGLVRFDGVKFSTIEYNKNPTIENKKKIFQDTLFVDREGTLWIGGMEGLTKYHYKTGQFKTYTMKDDFKRDSIYCFNEDVRGSLWIGLNGGVNRFANGKFNWFNLFENREDGKIKSIIEDLKGNLLVGTHRNGMFKFRNNKFFKYEIKRPGHKINKIYKNRKGELWIGTGKGLMRITDKQTDVYTSREGLSNEHILDILEDSDGNLWVGTLRGLNRFRNDLSGKVFFETLLENHIICCLFEDRENSLWIGTGESGIKRLENSKFITHDSVKKNQGEIIYSVFEDQQGDTWIGSGGGRLYRYRNGKLIESLKVHGKSNINIISLQEDSSRNLWMGTCHNGAFQRKGQTNTFINFTTQDGLADNCVNSIFQDSKHNLWFSTEDGVSRYRNGVFESFKTQDGLLGKIVVNTYEDKNHHIWILTSKGINILKDGSGKFTANNMSKHLKSIPVNSISQEGNVIWLGTFAGLIRFKDGVFICYNEADGLTGNYIFQVFEDDWENLWMSSTCGILRVSKDQLDKLAQRQIDKAHCTCYGINDGMISIKFYNTHSCNSALKTREGELWFVTKKGITMIHPGKVKLNPLPPPVIIEDVFFKGRDWYADNLLQQEKNVFKGIRNIGFHFTSPTFLSPGKIMFKYKLEGYDNNWTFLPLGERRMSRYNNLRPGTYTFRVTACNRDGIWNNTGASMAFTIKPCFQNSTSFKLLLLLSGLALASAGVFLYKKYLLVRNEKEKYKNSNLNPVYVNECIKKLDYSMEIEKVYQDENISLQSLSGKLSITPHQLSQILNEKLNKNFSDFINTYRVEEAKRILADPKRADWKILTIAFEVGFNTKVAFNTAFKKHTKMTPSQFRKKAMK